MTFAQSALARARDRVRAMQKDAAFTAGIIRNRPFQVLVQVTNRCNMQCSFCDFWPNPAPKRDELRVADFERISAELAGLGCFIVSIEGGEPLLRPDLTDIVRAFAKHHIPMLFTNGWHVDDTKAHALFDAGLVHASVSIDYADVARHDGKRGLVGTSDRAWRALETFKRAAPNGGKQVHVMTVLMDSNVDDIEPLLQRSAALGVGHQFTLLSDKGFRRGKSAGKAAGTCTGDRLPPAGFGARMTELWSRYPHIRYFRDYFERMDDFLSHEAMPESPKGKLPICRAGVQSFNIDHVGNVSPCIEKIDRAVGNVKEDNLETLHRRLTERRDEVEVCQDCWTACRGFTQAVGNGGTLDGFVDLARRMRPR